MIARSLSLKSNRSVRRALWIACLLSASCSSTPEVGTEGASCPNDNNCRPGLICVDMLCTIGARDGGPPVDLGVRDDGPIDRGVDVGPDVDPGDTGPVDLDPGDLGDGGPIDAGCNLPFTLSYIRDEIMAVGAAQGAECSQAACHGVSNAGGIRLDTPLAELRTALLGPTRDAAAPETQLVVPGDPATSRLWVIVSQENPAGNGERMPPGGLLTVCQQQSVFDWISDGAAAN